MVDLKELDLFESDINIAFENKPDVREYEKIIKEQQRFMRTIIKENFELREKILDMVMK